jgi:hypothetical protein
MAHNEHWTETPIKDGYLEVHLSSYRYLYELLATLITDTPAPYTSFIFRGHRRYDWKLEPSLDRELEKLGKLRHPSARKEHLRRFQHAMRGRRGPNPARLSDAEWWSLGQHHGLATPLLDWTASPFVAMYFAYFKENPRDEKPSGTDRRHIFALCRSVAMKNKELSPRKRLKFIRPLTDENARLVSQAGLFTRSPDGMCVEKWVKIQFRGALSAKLLKITFPESDRQMALRELNLMNINHLTLFPDASGASTFCNLGLRIQHY